MAGETGYVAKPSSDIESWIQISTDGREVKTNMCENCDVEVIWDKTYLTWMHWDGRGLKRDCSPVRI